MIYLVIILGFAVVSALINFIQHGLNVRRDYNVYIFGAILIASMTAFLLGFFFDFKHDLFFIGYGVLFCLGSIVSLIITYILH
ncbi:hypothetical protein [Tenuibacillus multivorans]|uniref:YesK-like protein n=1 Tax=Tenuibacillus multivorans TaxID=237069 RepID=A0A1H0B2Y5_9BACI|nr:hypothetical protein [Tenuibacillus multivorans]SDN40020.1 hypothetical protein SAMN05216498_2196 [Tenuibacillus multivorans]